MDLSLKGSQINLATKHKPKPPTIKYPILSYSRPSSANSVGLKITRPRSSSLRNRPQSADAKLARSLNNCIKFSEKILNEGKPLKNKKYLTTSSSNLLQLLLDEPIKRNFPISVNSNFGKIIDNKILAKFEKKISHQPLKSHDGSIEEGINYKAQFENLDPHSSITEIEHKLKFSERIEELKATQKLTSNFRPTSSMSSKGNYWSDSKPDLPGRVSFGGRQPVTIPYDIETSDDNQEIVPSTSGKKTVHFNEAVQAETYPKCSSDNCSCSTRSSHSNNSDGVLSPPENVGYPFEYPCNSLGFQHSHGNVKTINEKNSEDYLNVAHVEPQESQIIKDYKKTINDSSKKIELELKLNDAETARPNIYSNYLQKNLKENEVKSDVVKVQEKIFETNLKDNNSCEKNEFIEKYKKTKSDPLSISDSSLNTLDRISSGYSSSDNRAANNYLKISGDITSKKKTININNNSQGNKLSRKNVKNQRARSASASATDNFKKTGKPIRKSGTYSSLREDSNLDEFHLDKIDSWMSIHQPHGNRRNYSGSAHSVNISNQRNRNTSIYHRNTSPEDTTETSSKSDEQDDQEDSNSTYDEIVSVIKEINDEKKKDEERRDIDFEIEALLQHDTSNDSQIGNHRTRANDKLKDILNYLDDVENSCERTLLETRRSIPETNRDEVIFSVEPDIAEDVPKLADLLMLPNHQLARRVISLSLRANELATAIQLSKQHASQIRQEKQKAVRQEKQNASNRSREQKKYFESVIARHQAFIEQLLKDKAELCEKVTGLTRRSESQNQAWEHKLETEVSRIKETTLAGEKIRRERWVRENTKKIKDLTVKGLETEINQMNFNHEHQIAELKRCHQQEISNIMEELQRKHEQLENSIRETCAKDRETLVEKERIAIRERFEKQIMEERDSFDAQKTKIIQDYTIELEKKDNNFIQQREYYEKGSEATVQQVSNEYQSKLDQQQQKYESRINTIEKQFEADFVIWKREYENACKIRDVENENTIRQQYRTERDRQIDSIVGRMDAESQKCQEEFEMKMNRLKEKYEKDMLEGENLEKSLREKYNDVRTQLAESDSKAQIYHSQITQLQLELEYNKKTCNDLLMEKETIKDNTRNEVQHEIGTLKSERDKEIQKIYRRVQQAVEKKDTTIQLLQKENGTLRERIIKLDAIIRTQRRDYCTK